MISHGPVGSNNQNVRLFGLNMKKFFFICCRQNTCNSRKNTRFNNTRSVIFWFNVVSLDILILDLVHSCFLILSLRCLSKEKRKKWVFLDPGLQLLLRCLASPLKPHLSLSSGPSGSHVDFV